LYNLNFAYTEALVGNTSLVTAISAMGTNNTYASIHPILGEQSYYPDKTISDVSYEKGF